jgi:hypothetical protein
VYLVAVAAVAVKKPQARAAEAEQAACYNSMLSQ